VRTERASSSLVVMVALGFAAILSAFSVDVALVSSARARAQTAADAAALAAAQELVVPSGESPESVATEYAERGGAQLVECRCPSVGDEAVVTVEIDIALPLVGGTRTVHASARAVVAAPAGSTGLQPWFAARLACLFDAVRGLSIVSGFRTHVQQAALYQQKPDLAAPPGHSNHEIGLAADLGYANQNAEHLAHARAGGCGLEFPMSYEPWHIEPVEL